MIDIYLRVSTDDQAESGLGLAAQERACRTYCTLYELDVGELHVDAGVSAKTLNRPALKRALARLDSGAAVGLVVAKLDRLTRSVRDLGDLVERYFSGKVALHSVSDRLDTTTPTGRLVVNVLGSVAQWEREVIVERTKAAMGELKQQGKSTGNAPYGWRAGPDGVLVRDDWEQGAIDEARQFQRLGYSCRQISARMMQNGRLTRNGKPFSHSAIAAMLKATP